MFDYLRTIMYFLIFATVAGMLAPAGRFRKFVQLVTGMILLAVMVAPLSGMGRDIPITQWFAGLLPGQVYDWQSPEAPYHDIHLRNAFEAQLRAQLSNFLAREGVSVQYAEFYYTPCFTQITEIRVGVARAAPPRTPIIRIEPIRWRDRQEAPDECALSGEVRSLISQFYQIDPANIYVSIEGG